MQVTIPHRRRHLIKRSKKHIVSFSGGKDSTAMLLMMIDKGMQIDYIVFADTKFEFPEMYKHIKTVEKYIKKQIIRLKTPQVFENWLYGKVTRGKLKGTVRGFPLTLYSCYWSREAKYNMLNGFCMGHIRYIGITKNEPKRITYNKDYKYPLYEWGITSDECKIYLKEKGLLSPILETFSRTGCWWCPKQSNRSLEILYNNYPQYWIQMKKWEKVSPHGFSPGRNLVELETIFRYSKLYDMLCK